MKNCFAGLAWLLIASSAASLEKAPWFGDVYEFDLYTAFSYSQYSRIDSALVQPEYSYNNYVNDVAFGVTLTEAIDLELEMNLARTPHQTYGFRSAALQLRYLILNDTSGDPLSLTVGLNTRGVTSRAVRDVSSPYASYWNGEFTTSLGKEWIKKSSWIMRGFAFGSLGLANHGSFWNQYLVSIEGKFRQKQSLEFFSRGYFGYGSEVEVDIEGFKGWGFIRHSSIDVGAKYCYRPTFWGTLSLSYACRLWAQSFPKGEQYIEFSYNLPFSAL